MHLSHLEVLHTETVGFIYAYSALEVVHFLSFTLATQTHNPSQECA